MSKYRKKPVVIEAELYELQGDEFELDQAQDRIADFMGTNLVITADDAIAIKTLEGTMFADKGDWIIKGVKGEFYPCKPDIFEATYEPADIPGREGGSDHIVELFDDATLSESFDSRVDQILRDEPEHNLIVQHERVKAEIVHTHNEAVQAAIEAFAKRLRQVAKVPDINTSYSKFLETTIKSALLNKGKPKP